MRRLPTIAAAGFLALGATGFLFWLARNHHENSSNQADTGRFALQEKRPGSADGNAAARLAIPPSSGKSDKPFWAQAEVPEPASFRDAAGVDPASLGVQQDAPPPDFPAELTRLLETSADTKALNSLMLDWLSLDQSAARIWLEDAESLTLWQPAIRNFAGRIATDGNCGLALQWAEFVEAPDERERLVTDIYSRGFQTGHFTRDSIAAAPIPESDRENILNGSRRN